jgi:hypothetical protein
LTDRDPALATCDGIGRHVTRSHDPARRAPPSSGARARRAVQRALAMIAGKKFVVFSTIGGAVPATT